MAVCPLTDSRVASTLEVESLLGLHPEVQRLEVITCGQNVHLQLRPLQISGTVVKNKTCYTK